MPIVNIGILAHVDAGKTSLTERILYETGVIPSVGSVDQGTTQTDTLELERARGITIKSAVVSFQLPDRKVNLIDTPGHADFIAEVARSLRVLDGVILVVSAVEGVQPQTRRLARAIRAAGLPLLLFINKIDRLGARDDALLADIRRALRLRVVPLTVPRDLGSRAATVFTSDQDSPAWRAPTLDLLAETDERVIAEYERTGGAPSTAFLLAALREQVAAGTVVPAYFGSAITGVGVPELLDGVREWFPTAADDGGAPVAASVFKITRRPTGEKLVYLRLFAGELAVRQRVTLCRRNRFGEAEAIEERVTGLERFSDGVATQTERVGAGEIAVLHGLRAGRIGDRIGDGEAGRGVGDVFPVPTLESVVHPTEPERITQLRAALETLAEQDPLIALRQRNEDGEIALRLYGEVQKEVMLETLAREYGLGATFGPSRTICIERPLGTGEADEIIGTEGNPFYATVGFRVSPGERGSGVRYTRQLGALPLAFYRAIEETVFETLAQGLCGWEVTDCAIALTAVGMCPITAAGDFRRLVPLALMRALAEAGTVVCEPFEELELDVPEDTFGAVCGALIVARGLIGDTVADGATRRLTCALPTAELRGVEQQLPRLTRGEGGWESHFAGYVPVTGEVPTRRRVGPNPLNRAHYLAAVARG